MENVSQPAQNLKLENTVQNANANSFRHKCHVCADPVATDAPGAVYEYDDHGELEFITCAPCTELQTYRNRLDDAFKRILAGLRSAAPVGLESDYAETLEFAARALKDPSPRYLDIRANFETAQNAGLIAPDSGVNLVELLTLALAKMLEPHELHVLGRGLVHAARVRVGRRALDSRQS